jgi:hypothetical protein
MLDVQHPGSPEATAPAELQQRPEHQGLGDKGRVPGERRRVPAVVPARQENGGTVRQRDKEASRTTGTGIGDGTGSIRSRAVKGGTGRRLAEAPARTRVRAHKEGTKQGQRVPGKKNKGPGSTGGGYQHYLRPTRTASGTAPGLK